MYGSEQVDDRINLDSVVPSWLWTDLEILDFPFGMQEPLGEVGSVRVVVLQETEKASAGKIQVDISDNKLQITVLNISRDIGRYLVFACYRYDMGKLFAHIVCSKNGRYLKYRPINNPDMSRHKIGQYGFILIGFVFLNPSILNPNPTCHPII